MKSRAVAPVAAVVLLITLATWNSVHKSLWTDEVYSLITASGSLGHTIRRARDYELQPPLYFVLLNLWLRVSSAVPFVRALSTLGALATLVGLGAIAGRLRLGRGLSPVLLAAITPGIIWAAAEVRVYALMLALATGTLYFFLRLIADDGPQGWRDSACYALLAYALLMTGYYGGFLLAGQWLGAVAVGRWRRPSVALGAVAVGMLPWVPTILVQAAAHPTAAPASGGSADAFYDLTAVFLQGVFGNIPELAWSHVTVAIVCLVVIVAIARSRAGAIAPDERAVLMALATPIAILALIRVTGAAPMQSRYAVMTIPTLVTVAALWTDRPTIPGVRRLAAAAFSVMLIAGTVAFEWNGAEIANWRGVAALLTRDRTEPSQPVLVVPAQDALPLRYYYSGRGVVTGLAGEFDLNRYRPNDFRILDTAQILAQFDSTAARSGVWVVVSRSELQPPGQIRLVEGAIASRYCPFTRTDFRGVRVYHAVAPPCASSAPR